MTKLHNLPIRKTKKSNDLNKVYNKLIQMIKYPKAAILPQNIFRSLIPLSTHTPRASVPLA
ncbi:hypothetical protein SAMN05421542_4523 [Chryseobacterium jejuense]|uniref:Uncharacterized protein n=1 Tax=Chryseobacterium jejuense TaxID=445960 RepID=A0A2X2Z8X5_CHRJE|nr:hypothetical protein SAMN05421542_4523 [Chryseobacterium jejuense]SQB46880.1 Uncharacterised protein [Chryseobacterium jejuense]